MVADIVAHRGSLDEVAAVDIAIRRYYEKGGSGRVLGEGHRVAEGSQALGVIAREAIRVEAIEVAAAQLAIRLAVAEHVVGDHEDAVGDGDDGLLVAAPLDEPAVLGGEIGVAFADGARALSTSAARSVRLATRVRPLRRLPALS